MPIGFATFRFTVSVTRTEGGKGKKGEKGGGKKRVGKTKGGGKRGENAVRAFAGEYIHGNGTG